MSFVVFFSASTFADDGLRFNNDFRGDLKVISSTYDYKSDNEGKVSGWSSSTELKVRAKSLAANFCSDDYPQLVMNHCKRGMGRDYFFECVTVCEK